MCYHFMCDVHPEITEEWANPQTITVVCPRHGVAHDPVLPCPECYREAVRFAPKDPEAFNNPWLTHTSEVRWPIR